MSSIQNLSMELSDQAMPINDDVFKVTSEIKDNLKNLSEVIQSVDDVESVGAVSQPLLLSDLECLRKFELCLEDMREVLHLFNNTQSHAMSTFEDIYATVKEIEFTNQYNLDRERDEWLVEKETQNVINRKAFLTPLKPQQPMMEETAVFEILEQEVARSDGELASVKSKYELLLEQSKDEVERLNVQLSKVKEQSDILRIKLDNAEAERRVDHESLNGEVERLNLQLSNANEQSNILRAQLNQVVNEQMAQCEALSVEVKHLNLEVTKSNEESNNIRAKLGMFEAKLTECELLSGEVERLNLQLSKANEQSDLLRIQLEQSEAERRTECKSLELKYCKLSETLDLVAEKHIPVHMCPKVFDALPRIVHVFEIISQRCPWLYAALADENLDPTCPLPNPISLEIKQKLAMEQLILERNNAEDKLHRLTEELRLTQEAHARHVESTNKTIEEFEERIKRYKYYMGHLYHMSRPQVTPSTNASIPNSCTQSSSISGSISHELQITTPAASANVASPSSSKSASSTLLTRVGRAVSSIISPRRRSSPPNSPKQICVIPSPSGPVDPHPTPSSYSASPRSSFPQMRSQLPVVDLQNPVEKKPLMNLADTVSHRDMTPKSSIENVSTQPTSSRLGSSGQFVMPHIPSAVAARPCLGKRKPLGEMPLTKDTGKLDWMAPSPIVHKTTLSARQHNLPSSDDCLSKIHPLAESTSSIPFIAANKRTRIDPLPSCQGRAAISRSPPKPPSPPVASRLPSSPLGVDRGCNPS